MARKQICIRVLRYSLGLHTQPFVLNSPRGQKTPRPLPPFCLSLRPGFEDYLSTRIPMVAFESLLFLLSITKCLSLRPLNHNVPVVMRLTRDGTIYFALIPDNRNSFRVLEKPHDGKRRQLYVAWSPILRGLKTSPQHQSAWGRWVGGSNMRGFGQYPFI
ncbi:hypothetical protein NLI96_g8324 [Meripilus lineatus]|uniref:Uncharacterized protein n=1 Tax=Meripilus lineatus TaxID=2056292 RepID=A0AAD5YGB7_9APHY|nr:hypothetical protein NLI96_g8324 [Physisporinus lineatus]